MAQPVTQQRICYLEQLGEDYLIEMIAEGLYLSDVVERIDPGEKVGITKSFLSQWFQGKQKRNITWTFEKTGLEVGTETRPPETAEQAAERGRKYALARESWAENVVEKAGRKLMEEDNDKLANLRKAQTEFAFRIASIFDKRYAAQAANQVNVQVNVQTGEEHLNALRRRSVRAKLAPVEVAVIAPTSTEVLSLPAISEEDDGA